MFANTVTGSTLTDFPVLVKLNSSRINYADTQNAGQDLRFIDAAGNLLAHEIESWNESGDSYVWVKVPQIATTTDYIWLYYGNAAAPAGQNATEVWSNNYRGVWHMEAGFADSSPYKNHGRSSLSPTTTIGQVANAQNYIPSGPYINVGSDTSIDNIFAITGGTLSAWIYPRGYGDSDHGRIANKATDVGGYDGWAFSLENNALRFQRGYVGPRQGAWVVSSAIMLNTWQYVVLTYQDGAANDPAMYINGTPQTAVRQLSLTTTAVSESENDLWLGNIVSNTRTFNGIIDEVWLAKGQQSPEWIQAQYRSAIDALINYETPETTSAGPGGIIGAPYTYTLAISNSSLTTAATDVVVSDTVPAGANYVSGGLYAGGSVTWTIPAIAPTTTATVTYVVTTCQVSLDNNAYQVVGSNEGVSSAPGPALLTLFTPPTLAAGILHSTPILSEPVLFTATTTTNGGPITGYAWNFDNGQTAAGATTSATFAAAGTYTVTLTITDSCGYTATTTQPLTVLAPALSVSKTAQPATLVAAGGRLTYTVVVSNNGLGPATGVVVSDTIAPNTQFDAGSVLIAPPAAGGTTGAPPLIAQNLTIQPDSAITVTYAVTVTGGNLVTNTAAVTGLQNSAPISASATVPVFQAPPVLQLTKTATHANPLRPGQRITYTIVVSNSGLGLATGGVISDFLPAQVEFIPASLLLEPQSAGSVGVLPALITNLSITAGQRVTITFAVTVTRPITNGVVLTNTAAVTAAEVITPQRGSATATVLAVPAVSIAKTGPATATVGSLLTYTLTITNPGDSLLQIKAVVDDLTGPAALPTGDSNGNGWLDLDETWQYVATYTVKPADSTPLVNTVTVTAADGTGALVTASARHTATIEYAPAVTITKTGPATAVVGQTVIFTFTVSHAPTSDGSPLSQVVVIDDFAGGATQVTNGDGDLLLEAGETWVYTAGYTILATTPNPFTNTARVWAQDSTNALVTASAQHRTDLSGFAPQLFVDKDGPVSARVGQAVVFTFTVINVNLQALQLFKLGPVGIASVGDGSPIRLTSVNDSVAGPATRISGDANGNNRLDGAEAWVFTAGYTIPATGTHTLANTVTVTGLDQNGGEITAEDNHVTDILYYPLLQLAHAGPTTATVTQTIYLTYTLSHAAGSDTSPVSQLKVTNSLAGVLALLPGSDGNGNNMLDALETWRYATSYTVKISDPRLLTNTTVAAGKNSDNQAVLVTDTYTIEVDKSSLMDVTVYLPLIVKEAAP